MDLFSVSFGTVNSGKQLTVQRTAWPFFVNFSIKSQIAQEVWESRPEVGSSRKSSNSGLAANSTPIVKRLRCSTLRPEVSLVGTKISTNQANKPSPGTPTTASAYSCMSKSLMTSLTYANFSLRGIFAGCLRRALKFNASRTVVVERWRSCC